MPYKAKGKCVYKKDTGAKVGCTKGDVNDYLAALHMNANESVKEEEKIVGGKADNMTLPEIAKLHKVSLDKIESQLKKGIKVELEHVDTESEAREIAMDHLVEMPDYYSRLNKMEKTASKEEKVNEGIETTKTLIKRLIRENLMKK